MASPYRKTDWTCYASPTQSKHARGAASQEGSCNPDPSMKNRTAQD